MSRLPALSAKATDSLYDITVQNIRINIFTRAGDGIWFAYRR
jgi:hypothetical protein